MDACVATVVVGMSTEQTQHVCILQHTLEVCMRVAVQWICRKCARSLLAESLIAECWQCWQGAVHGRDLSFVPSTVAHVIIITCALYFIALCAQANDASRQHTYLLLGAKCLVTILNSFLCKIGCYPALPVYSSKLNQLQGSLAAPQMVPSSHAIIDIQPATDGACNSSPAARRQGSSSTTQAPQRTTCSRTECRLLQSRIARYIVHRTLLGKCCSPLSSQGSARHTPQLSSLTYLVPSAVQACSCATPQKA